MHGDLLPLDRVVASRSPDLDSRHSRLPGIGDKEHSLFADHLQQQREIEQFWLDVAQLSERSLCKSYVNVYSKHSKKKRINRLPYGTVRVTVCRTRVVQSIFGSIQEYAGFDRAAWLE